MGYFNYQGSIRIKFGNYPSYKLSSSEWDISPRCEGEIDNVFAAMSNYGSFLLYWAGWNLYAKYSIGELEDGFYVECFTLCFAVIGEYFYFIRDF